MAQLKMLSPIEQVLATGPTPLVLADDVVLGDFNGGDSLVFQLTVDDVADTNDNPSHFLWNSSSLFLAAGSDQITSDDIVVTTTTGDLLASFRLYYGLKYETDQQVTIVQNNNMTASRIIKRTRFN